MKDAAKIPVTTHDSLDGRPDALASVEGRAGSVLREGPGVWSPAASWASAEGVVSPLGATWIEEARADNFSLYSRHAERVTLLLFGEADPARPLVALELDPRRHKTWDVWHCRVGEDDARGACYYAYSTHADHFRFVRLMIAFRQAHPTLCRSRFWRDDVRWYGVGPSVDMGDDSHSLAYAPRGASQGDRDLYVMINAYHEPLTFMVQEGRPGSWERVIDTAPPSPDDIVHPARGPLVPSVEYRVQARSVVVLVRRTAVA